MKSLASSCAVVISSCDTFRDAWEPFFTLFFRYWPNCPFSVYLISNDANYLDSRVKQIKVGPDKGWADNTKAALSRITEQYVLFLLEDLFFEKQTDTAYILKLLEHLKEKKAACIQLFPSSSPDEFCEKGLALDIIGASAPHRVSLLACLWDKEIFTDLIREGENPWQMEINGTERSRNIKLPFLNVRLSALNYLERSAIIRGKWTYEAVQLCRREGILLDFGKRGVDYNRYWRFKLDQFQKINAFKLLRRIPVVGTIGTGLLQLARRLLSKE